MKDTKRNIKPLSIFIIYISKCKLGFLKKDKITNTML